jgi:hypothetical protein
MNKKTLIGVGLALVTLSTLSFAATKVGKMGTESFAIIQAAIASNDYASLPDTVRLTLTEERFNDMVAKQAEHAALEASIEAGDYVAFKNAMIAQIPSEADFQKMVTEQKTRTEHKTKLETAVKNNDFTAYKALLTEQKAQMETHRPEGMKDDKVRPEPTDEQLQKRFDALVASYTENGTLPDTMVGGPGYGGKMGGHGRGGHGGPMAR